jgi:hypothetical protein
LKDAKLVTGFQCSFLLLILFLAALCGSFGIVDLKTFKVFGFLIY